MNTLLLDQTLWDLVLDANNNIALASDPYSVAQDVASYCRTFLGECWYNTTLGLPYFTEVLGQAPPLSLLKTLLEQQAIQVPGCNKPTAFFTGFTGRQLTGQIQFTDNNGTNQTASF